MLGNRNEKMGLAYFIILPLLHYLLRSIGGEAVDDKDLARRKCRDTLKTPPNVQLLVLRQDYNGNVSHNLKMIK